MRKSEIILALAAVGCPMLRVRQISVVDRSVIFRKSSPPLLPRDRTEREARDDDEATLTLR